MNLSPQWIDELRSRITLSGVIGRTVRILKAGREFKACCPFHGEKTPSFTINDEKGFYHCFGCGAHGDVIRWMTEQRGLSFMDAIKELAEEAGMEVPAPDPRAAERAQKQAGLHDAMAAAQSFFMKQLEGPEGGTARAYLATRGFRADIIEQFGFGYAPEGRQAMKQALTALPEALLIEGGLRITVDGKEPYDRFRGRLMLPIQDARGRVIAFGGRILDKTKTDAPKYLNSPDTPLFDKGRTLYNQHRASPASRQSGRIIVVEGYMDVIALANAGFPDAVAPLGTALTETQIEMLWRMVETPILCFDGDAAGQRAAMRAITRALPLLRPAHSLRIVRMPPGQDPDELIKAQGPQAMEAALAGAQSLLDTLWAHERDALPTDTPEAKAGLKARLMAHVDTIADKDIKSLYRSELLERFSAYAFPRRDNGGGRGASPSSPQRAWQPPRSGGRFGRDYVPETPHPRTAAMAARPAPWRAAALDAVVGGLIRNPSVLSAQIEPLARLAGEDPRIDLLVDAAMDGEFLRQGLDPEAMETILRSRGFMPPAQEPVKGMGFTFLHGDDEAAHAQLVDVIGILTERPLVEAALALASVGAELSDAAWQEQQRLLQQLNDVQKRELDLKARLGQMLSRGSGADDASGGMKS
ncbi:MAG: DNA primase [Sphingomonadales bacterium]|nr:DNA primase [Sphingomonadales bacterium]MDE2169337.1 DNA primase [Sphingomonadales bacterium]